MNIGVIGSGSWGTALVKILTDNHHDVIWCVRSEKLAEHIRARHHNPKYLSSVYFNSQQLEITTDPAQVYEKADAVVIAVPSAYAEGYITPYLSQLLKGVKIISAVKGMLPSQNMLLNEHLASIAGFDPANYVTIMGPCHAEEVAGEKLSYLTFAGINPDVTASIAACFKTSYINTVQSEDVIGVQYAAVLKNIYAMGAGIAHGLGYGDNFQSVLVANAAGEMVRFLKAISGEVSSCVNYSSSVYLGDLLVTCYSLFSRNRSFGNMIGKGYSVEATKLAMQMVAEGYPAAKCIAALNEKVKADMPIATGMYNILWEAEDPIKAFEKIEAVLI
ncbi:MAG: NAD(P)-binding domain-containing protein [Chitinophagaceae bacterium]|nr:NAD(P)-binding domain-containing protein [Chitinophagaceae bacterium]